MRIPLLLAALTCLAFAPLEDLEDGEDVRRYEFSASGDLDDFDVAEGEWRVSGGALVCTSKGDADEIRWRRRLSESAVLETELSGLGSAGLLFQGGGHRLLIEVRPTGGTYTVHLDGKELKVGYFEAARGKALDLIVHWNGEGLRLKPGDDYESEIPFPAPVAGLSTLSLLSRQAQNRFLRLVVHRPASGTGEGPVRDGPGEQAVLEFEDAARLLQAGQAEAAYEVLRPWIPQAGAGKDLPESFWLLLQQVALDSSRVRREEPLRSLLKEREIETSDGSVSVTLPLRVEWQGEAPLARRVDGELLRIRCRKPALTVTVRRYDQRIQYWFGEEPRTLYVSGSSSAALARARAEDLTVERAAELSQAPRRSRLDLDGQTTTEFRARIAGTGRGEGETELWELYAPFRGNAHRVAVEGSPAALRSAAMELEWILATLTFSAD